MTKPLATDFDIHRFFAQYSGEGNSLYAENVNPQLARALRIIGFDNTAVRLRK